MAKNLDAGMLTFDGGDSKTRSIVNVEFDWTAETFPRLNVFLLQALGVGVSCGSHWSSNMSVTMNLLIHAWGKLFLSLLEEDSNCTTLSGENVPFGKVVQFYRSVLEIFQWDMIYQHCLPWLSQFASSTIKSLISFKKFGHKEVIEVCLRLLHMTETSVNEIYTWRAVSDRSSVHLLGDTFSPSCVTVCLPTATRTDTIPGNQRSVNLETTLSPRYQVRTFPGWSSTIMFPRFTNEAGVQTVIGRKISFLTSSFWSVFVSFRKSCRKWNLQEIWF